MHGKQVHFLGPTKSATLHYSFIFLELIRPEAGMDNSVLATSTRFAGLLIWYIEKLYSIPITLPVSYVTYVTLPVSYVTQSLPGVEIYFLP